VSERLFISLAGSQMEGALVVKTELNYAS